MAFYVGQKVVCVNDSCDPPWLKGVRHNGDIGGLKAGSVYTVRAAGIEPYYGQAAIWLAEIVRADGRLGEGGFNTLRFRPIVERKTDISIFKAMLNPSKQEVSA